MCNLQMCNKNVLKWDDIWYYLILNINGDAFELNVLALYRFKMYAMCICLFDKRFAWVSTGVSQHCQG